MTKPNLAANPPAYGIWHVTTEGDVEGRTTRDLGTHEGYLDDVAFALAGQQCYGLRFELVDTKAWTRDPPRTKVNVSLDIGTGTWDMSAQARVLYFSRIVSGRDVSVSECNYYACVTLTRGINPAEQERARNEALRLAALAKLSDAERKALGL